MPEIPLTVLIVDDEPLAREGLAHALRTLSGVGGVPQLQLVGEAANGEQGAALIREQAPDVVLADIAMPGLDGVEMFEELEPESLPPAVIFVTAHEEHALRAFGVQALDYLMKPVSMEALGRALMRAADRIAEQRALRATLEVAPDAPPATGWLQRIIIPERGTRLIVPVADVEWIEGETYYVRVHAAGRARLLRERMSVLEAALDPGRFFRCHRSAIVQFSLVREIRATSPYAYVALLASGARVPVSRTRRVALEQLLSLR